MSLQPYLGTNVNPASVDEMHYRGLIAEGETLLGMFDGVLLDEHNRRVGGIALSDFVALTDQRVITWARGFFNDTVDTFAWQDVDVAEAGTWDPFHGRVRLAFRLAPVAPRTRRIAVKGNAAAATGNAEQVVINTLDYMPADDVTALARMVEWVGDQVIAGLSGDELLAAFAEQFPAPERAAPMPFFAAPPAVPPPPAPPPEAPARKRWWQLSGQAEERPALPESPAGLIAAYESQRSGLPGASAAPSRMPLSQPSMPIMPEQPSMYDVSRSLRLMLEAPRRIARGLRRATEAASGASELVNNMQDPRVRRNAIAGMRQAVAQHEEQNGPLAPVAPLARAVLAFSEPLDEELPPQQQTDSRRIQVRAAVRNGSGAVRPAPGEAPARSASPLPPAEQPAEIRATAAVRRSIAVRRAEPEEAVPPSGGPQRAAPAPVDRVGPQIVRAQQEEPAAPNGHNHAETPRPAVRRIVLNRSEE